MSDDERRMARALAACTFVPGIGTKRFARQMAHMAESTEAQITDPQAEYLRSAVRRFRRQIPAEVVALAGEAQA
jgi:hypothetical protein